MTVQRMLNEDANTADAVVRVLIEAGIEFTFGITGGQLEPLFGALERKQNAIRTILVREESLGGVMAEVYGRLRRKPGVLIGQGPWALGNGMIGILEAHLASSPMLILSDFTDKKNYGMHAPFNSGAGDYGTWDARSAYRSVTKEVFQALEPTTAVQATQLAIKHSLSGEAGPVAVIFGSHCLGGTVQKDAIPRIYPTSHYMPKTLPAANEADVRAAVKVLADAKKPVIVAGNGVRIADAYAHLQKIAELLGCPVTTTAAGKGVFAETHPLALGVMGSFGTAAANACVGEADLVLVIGSKLGASDIASENPDLLDPERQTFVQIDIEPRNASWTFPANHTLVGDAAVVLDQLQEAMAAIGNEKRLDAGKGRVAGYREKFGYFEGEGYSSDISPVHPQRIIGELMRNLPEDAIVTCDAGENRIMMTNLYQTKKAGGYLMAAGAAPMGYAIPAAMGAKLVHPDRPVVAVVGDGGFCMTMNGLMTARENDIPIVVVVFNNSALGWALHNRSPFATKFGDFDHAAIARAMGCEGIRITEPQELAGAIKTAIASNRPTVIDVITALDAITSLDVTSPLVNAMRG